MDAAVNLREQPEIKELFYALEKNGLAKEQQEVETLVDYLEGMENRFGEMIEELREVRGQLTQIQDRGVKATAIRVLDSAENKVREIRGQISLVRQNFARSAKNAVETFKENGVGALRKAVSAMKIPHALESLQKMFHSGVETMNRSAEKTGIVREELHKAAGHMKNVGRALLGRQTRETAKQDMDKGILAKVQRAYLSCGQLFSSMEKSAENAMRRMEKFTGEKKPSVKGELKRIKSKQSAEQAMQPMAREKVR